EEVLFAEAALFMGADEFKRRVAVLAANGSNDLVQPSWKKDEGAENYAIDRFSPYLVPRWTRLRAPFETGEIIESIDPEKVSRRRS
ncbi:hypothetical protein ABTE40_21010, partial [Acinetobacter baumannii]